MNPTGTKPPKTLNHRHLELPTLLVAVAIYGGWLVLTLWHAVIPPPLLALLGGLLLAWHGSLQHETIHGHPTGNRAIDTALGFVPLSFWLPYAIYRKSHLAHHATRQTTDPYADPESHYRAEARGWRYHLARLEAPLAARLLFGPPIRVGLFLGEEFRRAWTAPGSWARDWLPHLAALLPVLWWLDYVGLSLGTYLLAFVYPGTALSLLRSFAEHRADVDPGRRAAIVRRPGVFGLLFLNNNLHAVHHAHPELAWYLLPVHYRANPTAFAHAPFYDSYSEVVRHYAWRPQDEVVHPDYRTVQ